MPSPRALRAIALSVAVLALAAGCTSDSTPSSRPRSAPGGTLRIGIIDTDRCPLTMCGETWDPQISFNNVGFELGRCCMLRSLLSYQADPHASNQNQVQPDLAAELPTIAPDGLTWTFHLREGLHYAPPLQDVPVTSQDFVRSIERALSPRPANQSEGFGEIMDFYTGEFLGLADAVSGAREYVDGSQAHISGLETPDPSTLVFRLTRPSGTLGTVLAFPDLTPIPPDPNDPAAPFGIATDLPRMYGRFAAVTGPYMVEGAGSVDLTVPPEERLLPAGDTGASYTLVRDPSWDPAQDPLRPAPSDRIVFTRVDDDRDLLAQVSSGALDAVWDWQPATSLVSTARSMDGLQFQQVTLDALRYLGLNVAVPPLDDVHVRRAIAYAVDRPAVGRVFDGVGSPSVVATQVGLDDEEGDLLLNYDGFGIRDGPDLAAARSEMAQSRYDSDGDGRCDAAVCDGIHLIAPVVTYVGDRAPGLVAPPIAHDLAAIGLGVHADVMPTDGFFGLYGQPQERIAMRIDGWFKDGSGAGTWFPPLFGSSRLSGNGFANDYSLGASPAELERWGYDVRDVPNVDDRLDECLRESFGGQLRCWAEFDRYMTDDIVASVPLISDTTTVVVAGRVDNVAFDHAASPPTLALDQLVVGPDASSSPSASPPPSDDPLEGRYRVTITEADARSIGLTRPVEIDNELGTFVLDLHDGVWAQTQFTDEPVEAPLGLAGSYTVEGDTLHMEVLANRSNAAVLPTFTWHLEGDRLSLDFSTCDLDPGLCAALDMHFTMHPLEAIG